MLRRFNYYLVLVLFLILVLGLSSFAETIDDTVMRRGMGARAAGMGGAHTAVAEDGSAVFYNPACLATTGIAYSYGNPDSDQKNYKGGFELLKLGYIGYIGWGAEVPNGDKVMATAVGFGNKQGWLSWGTNFKTVNWTLSGIPKEGWSGDVGFLVRVTPQFDIGILGQDILTSKDFITPASSRVGFGFHPFDGKIILAGDVEINRSARTYGHLGLEVNLTKGLAIRGGADRGEPTAGISLDLALFNFDYAALFSNTGQTLSRFEAGIKILPRKERPSSFFKPKEYALIDIAGAIKGGRNEYSFLGGARPGLDSILSQIRKAAKDSGIDGILVRIGGFEGGLGGMAIVQELRNELGRARGRGKKIVAYVEGSAVGDEYYLASAADRIIAPPGAAIGGFGKSLEIYRMRGLYNKFGIDMEIIKQGKYKDAFDPYRKKMNPEQEEMARGLMAELYRQMLTDIAADRKKKLSEMKEIGDGMIFTAQEAKKKGLIDVIGYFEEARRQAAEMMGDKKNEAVIVEPRLLETSDSLLSGFFGVAVIEIDGEIISGGGGENIIFGGRYVGSDSIAAYIRKAGDDPFIKAVILRINSPGGDAIAAGEIYKSVKYARDKKKTVIASIGNMGASGGYYIACAADKIVADPSSLTGSIGVIGHMQYISGLLKKLDIETEVIKEGKHADMFSGLRRLTTEEIVSIEKLQAENYDEFVKAVAEGRKLPTEEVRAKAEGRIYLGSQALELKLVDKLGGFCDAVDLAKTEAKLTGDPRLVFYHEPSFFFTYGEGITEALGIREWLPWKFVLPRSDAEFVPPRSGGSIYK